MKRRDFITKNAVVLAGLSLIPAESFATADQQKFISQRQPQRFQSLMFACANTLYDELINKRYNQHPTLLKTTI